MQKEQAKENLRKLVEKFEREFASGQTNEYSEEATKIGYVQPFLKDVLGWDVNDINEVKPEHKVSRGRVDYSLKIDGKSEIFVEAKAIREDLNKFVSQAVNYGYNHKDVPFVMLTDFEGLKLFDVTIKPDLKNYRKGLKLDLNWKEYLDEFDEIWKLSKESVLNGEINKLLTAKAKEKIPVDKAVLDSLENWRLSLAKDIYKNNHKLFSSDNSEANADYLKSITQKLLDRIIFIRFCEDRALYQGAKLNNIFEERTGSVGTKAMLFLKDTFAGYRRAFDSDLFLAQPWEGELAIDFEVMKEIVMDTYNPYQFDVIPLEVLGSIYEQYLGHTIHLTEQQVRYVEKAEVRKAGGVYYTPEYIVDYIVKNTVGKLLEELTPAKAKKIKILDPACGSGSFLIRAYGEMLGYYKRLKKESRKKGAENQQGLDLKHEEAEARLTIPEKCEILKNHIFGVDIDEQAVEVTKLSLMLKMLEDEHGVPVGQGILPKLEGNIKCGNSLISGSTLEMKKYFGDDYYKIREFNWKERFNSIMDNGGFDVVIGNPPYGYMISDEQQKYFSEVYINQDYQKDLYLLFLERYEEFLKEQGLLGVIVSNTWLQSLRLRKIRSYLATKYSWDRILLLPEKVFSAVVDTHVLIFKNTRKGIQNNDSVIIDIRQKDKINFKQKLRGKDIPKTGEPINVSSSSEIKGIVDKILSNSTSLSEKCDVYNGVKPFEKGKGDPPQTDDVAKGQIYVKKGERPSKEWKPLLRGSLINSYPGETDEEFQTLLDFVEEMRFDRVGAFQFSFESGTASEALGDPVPAEVKEKRYQRLMEL
ncbi:MAG: N-6 DNA methylase, partial [Elusimicrobia bacterium]|nr:N-6 DNA methylase [Elusimicrobiota bacterium]